MKNYLYINGNKVELTEEQIAKMAEVGIYEEEKKTVIDNVKTVMIGKHEFIVLNRNEENGTVELLLKGFLGEETFGSDCDYKKSNVKKVIDKFQKEIEGIIGTDSFVEYTLDLTADDGLKDYGEIKTKMSLLTCDMYRKYVEQIDEYKLDKWWWLATPWSTPKHGYETTVLCVSPRGILNYNGCFYNICGVRPFCILKSCIFNA